MNVRFPCPVCGKKLVTEGKPGARLTCPGCQAKLRVPAMGETPAPAVGFGAVMAGPPKRTMSAAAGEEAPNNTLRAVVVLGSAGAVLLGLVITAIVLMNSGGAREPEKGPPSIVQVDPKKPADPGPGSIDAKTTPDRNDAAGPGWSKPRSMEPVVLAALERGKAGGGPGWSGAKGNPEPTQVAFNPPTKDPFPKKPKDKEPMGGAFAQPLDNFGNPKAQDAGLIKEGDFRGKRLLVWSGTVPVVNNLPLTNPLLKRLTDLGMKVRVERPPFRPEWLRETDLFFLFSTNRNVGTPMTRTDIDAVEQYVRSGKALYLMSDNDPLIVEADALGQRLFGTRVSGDYNGEKTAYVRARNMTPDQVRKFKGQYPVEDHFLLKGVNFIWEGTSISNIAPCDKLEVVLRASDGKILAAVSKIPEFRVVMDAGHTRYYPQYVTNTPGTVRFAENVAAYLLAPR